ncbi:MAG: type II toxin-antitoxin system PemK/MazF family toxin [Gammaproteobacteria bacterium]
MKTPMAIYDAFDVVVVPFPFTDRTAAKRRPALVLSHRTPFAQVIEHSVMAMITSAARAPWPLDAPIRDPAKAGLTAASLVRMKLFTLDHRLIIRKTGALSTEDRQAALSSLRKLFGL